MCKVVKGYLFCLIAIVILLSSPVVTANDTVQLKAGYLNYVEDKIEVSKGVKIVKDEVTLKAPRGRVNRKENRVFLQDGVEMNYELGRITSDIMTGLFKENKYIFEEKVIFTYQQTPESKNDGINGNGSGSSKGEEDNNSEQDKMVLHTPYLEVYQADNSFQARRGVKINYSGKLIEAEKADYNNEEEILTVKNDVYIQKENGDWVRGSQAVFYLGNDEDKFTVDGNVEIEIDISN